jgi:hypothetical protein
MGGWSPKCGNRHDGEKMGGRFRRLVGRLSSSSLFLHRVWTNMAQWIVLANSGYRYNCPVAQRFHSIETNAALQRSAWHPPRHPKTLISNSVGKTGIDDLVGSCCFFLSALFPALASSSNCWRVGAWLLLSSSESDEGGCETCKSNGGVGGEDRSRICLTSKSSSNMERSRVSLSDVTSMSTETVDGDDICVSISISSTRLPFEPGV